MRRLARGTAAVAFVSAILMPGVAAATGLVGAYVQMTSQGVTGVSGAMRVENRFADIAEAQFVGIFNAFATRLDDHAVDIALEIHESTPTSGQFHPGVHIFYADGDSTYPNDEYIWWDSTAVPYPAAHTLQLSQKVPNTSSLWNAYYDGTYVEDFWWPYPTGNTEVTAQEVLAYTLNSSSFFSMGHIWDIRYRLSNGTWVSQSTTPSNRMLTSVSNLAVGYGIVWFRRYDDWACNR